MSTNTGNLPSMKVAQDTQVPTFYDGMIVNEKDLNAIVESQRLMLLTLFGFGVVRGFKLESLKKTGKQTLPTWQIGAGVAVDNQGWPLALARPEAISFDDVKLEVNTSQSFALMLVRDAVTLETREDCGIVSGHPSLQGCNAVVCFKPEKKSDPGSNSDGIRLGTLTVSKENDQLKFDLTDAKRDAATLAM